MLKLLSRFGFWLANDALTALKNFVRWLWQHPYILMGLLALCAVFYWHQARSRGKQIETLTAQTVSLTADVIRLRSDSLHLATDKQNAYSYADSLGNHYNQTNKTSYEKDSLALSRLPAVDVERSTDSILAANRTDRVRTRPAPKPRN